MSGRIAAYALATVCSLALLGAVGIGFWHLGLVAQAIRRDPELSLLAVIAAAWVVPVLMYRRYRGRPFRYFFREVALHIWSFVKMFFAIAIPATWLLLVMQYLTEGHL